MLPFSKVKFCEQLNLVKENTENEENKEKWRKKMKNRILPKLILSASPSFQIYIKSLNIAQ